MKIKKSKTFQSAIYISCSEDLAKQVCAKFCLENPSCVTIEPLYFVFYGGSQSGVRVKFINYPRFESTPEQIKIKAESLAKVLLSESHQLSCSVVHSDETVYMEAYDKQ